MASLPSGSDVLLLIRTDRVSVTVKGRASHPDLDGAQYESPDSSVRIVCEEDFSWEMYGETEESALIRERNGRTHLEVRCCPLFYEQRSYEILIEAAPGHTASFWHDSKNIRDKVTRTGQMYEILSGIINFGNEIGYSDLYIQVDHRPCLTLTLEVFPTKLRYREDYQAILADVTREIYSMAFDFLKKTYAGYRQGDRTGNSPAEFFAVIRQIYGEFVRAADQILRQPHHVLETVREVVPGRKARRTDSRTLSWLEKHPGEVMEKDGQIGVQKVLAVRRQVSFDTPENRMSKYILEEAERRLRDFERAFRTMGEAADEAVSEEISGMIAGIRRRKADRLFASLPARTAETGMSLVFSLAPGYRDLYRYYLMLQRGLNITGDLFHISVKDLAVLYEYWCFIKLNSLMKDRYRMVSQDIVRVRENGLCISLVKGQDSRVKYRNPQTGETIVLSYNPKVTRLPTLAQRPDNVLTLEKTDGAGAGGTMRRYRYIFDAKYRLNPALPGTEYHGIFHTPGPEEGDINTMHRYRDAIVFQNEADERGRYERTMFGAYVLFPYHNEEEYRNHQFYKSIAQVNIGGLPFLPSATGLVTDLLDELVNESAQSGFERSTLSAGTEERLMKVDWSVRDVLVGRVSDRETLARFRKELFYEVEAGKVSDVPIRCVALYQTSRASDAGAGIQLYGEVVRCTLEKTGADASGSRILRLYVQKWKTLPRRISPRGTTRTVQFTNRFLLEHSSEMPELSLRSEAEYRLYQEMKRAAGSPEINEEGNTVSFAFQDALVVFEDQSILLYRGGDLRAVYSLDEFLRRPGAVFRQMKGEIIDDHPASP